MAKVTDEQLTAASMPLKLGDTEFQASPLSDKDYSTLTNWIRAEYLELVEGSLNANISNTFREEIIAAAAKEVAEITFFDRGTGSKIMATFRGMTRLAWQMVQKEHRGITHERVMELAGESGFDKIFDTYRRLNLGFLDETSEEEPKKKKKSRKN